MKTFNESKPLQENIPGLVNTEEHSSLSEQAWDSYQEKYLSEAYSEAHDSDAARRLLEFGEDYRNFLDSQSDWSNHSNNFSPPFQRKVLKPINFDDSDSDSEDVKQLLKNSRDTYEYTNQIYTNHFNLGLNKYLVANDFVSIIVNYKILWYFWWILRNRDYQ